MYEHTASKAGTQYAVIPPHLTHAPPYLLPLTLPPSLLPPSHPTPYLPLRGFTEEDFEQVAVFFDRAVDLVQTVKQQVGPKMKDYKAALEPGSRGSFPALLQLASEVQTFSRSFPTVGF